MKNKILKISKNMSTGSQLANLSPFSPSLKVKTIVVATTLLFSQFSFSEHFLDLAELKKHISKQEFMQYTHEVWNAERKTSQVSDYSDLLNNINGNTLTVGPGDDCGFPNILTAINFSAPGDTIMIAQGTYSGVEAQLTINKSLSIIGGLDDNCQVFTINRTALQLDDFGPVLDIDVTGGAEVLLSGLDISGAIHENFSDYDGGIHVRGDGTLTINNTHIHNNESFFGGAIAAREGVKVILNQNTEIYNNSAIQSGGGIFCADSEVNAANIMIGRFAEGEAQGNIATNDDAQGGGIYANNCQVLMGDIQPNSGPVEINYNKAKNGSGIFGINSGISLTHVGSRISFNGTISKGSVSLGTAILLESESAAQFQNVSISDNDRGDLIRIGGQSNMSILSTCQQSLCSEIIRNEGGVFSLLNTASGSIQKTLISDNFNANNSLIFSASPNDLYINNSIIANNNDFAAPIGIFRTTSIGLIQLDNVTIANNTDESLPAIFATLNSGTIVLNGGIVWGNGAAALESEAMVDAIEIKNSVIQYDTTGLVNTIQADPLFVGSNNFHIQYDSPARDLFNSDLTIDFEDDPRPQGPLDDAGADEFKDLIFKNDYEQE